MVGCCMALPSCSGSNDPEDVSGGDPIEPEGDDGLLFVINEGNFQYSNATLSIYDPETQSVENEAFIKANGMKLGDVAQSMTIADGRGWIAVNNSNVVFAIDPLTLKEKGRIENLVFPRYLHFVSDKKAYVSQLWDNRIAIVDPRSYSITGHITVPDMKPGSGSTEQMVSYGDYVYCNCWSYQKRIIKIDTRTDEVVASLEVGLQPNSLVLDRYGKLWTVTDGGYEGSPFGYEPPALVKIDAETFTIEDKFSFELGESCSEICINEAGDRIYWINDDIWSMDVTAQEPPATPLIHADGTLFYGLTVAPVSGEVYAADAIDHSQNGRIYRYSPQGTLIDHFSAGVNPGAFCWYRP